MCAIRHAFSVAALLCFVSSSQAAIPRVTVEYFPRQDFLCSLLPGSSIKEAWKAELLSRQSEFVKLWDSEGPRLLAATETVSGKAFPPQEITARLTLCDSPSEAFPRTDRAAINMRYALGSFTPTPVSLRYKVDTLYHELLHVFLFHHPIENSALLKEHANEPERVLSHLHLMALQKAVLLRLDETDALAEAIAIDSALPGGYYKRAWELVNTTDSEYLRYVAELSK